MYSISMIARGVNTNDSVVYMDGMRTTMVIQKHDGGLGRYIRIYTDTKSRGYQETDRCESDDDDDDDWDWRLRRRYRTRRRKNG